MTPAFRGGSVVQSGAPARLRVAMLSLPARTEAVLEYFILGAGRSAFTTTDEADADAVIVDHDNPESKEHWNAFKSQHQRPALLLSVMPLDVPDAIWIRKPASPAALLAAAAQLAAQARSITPSRSIGSATELRAMPAVPPPALPISPPALTPKIEVERPIERSAHSPITVSPVARAPESTVGQERVDLPEADAPADAPAAEPIQSAQAITDPEPTPRSETPSQSDTINEGRFCGQRLDGTPAEINGDPSAFFRLDRTFVYALKDAYFVARKWNVQTRLDLPDGSLAVDLRENRVYLGCDRAAVDDLCARTFETPLRVHTLSTREFEELREEPSVRRANAAGSRPVTIERADSFLWEVALATAKGRLPVGTELDRTFYLKRWPNLTRLAAVPNVMRIAAIFAVRGATLPAAAKLLGVPQRHVFACYNGFLALELVTTDGSALQKRQKKAHKNRALLTRLFRWLRGKG